jgi:hypothetical protein
MNAFEILSEAARLAESRPHPIQVLVKPGGLLFNAFRKPFHLQHFLTFEKLQLLNDPPIQVVRILLNKMDLELEQTRKDAQEDRNVR